PGRDGCLAGGVVTGETEEGESRVEPRSSPCRSCPPTALEFAVRALLLADQLHVARVAGVGLAAVPADPRPLDVVLVDEGDGPLVHVLVLRRVEIGPAGEEEADLVGGGTGVGFH